MRFSRLSPQAAVVAAAFLIAVFEAAAQQPGRGPRLDPGDGDVSDALAHSALTPCTAGARGAATDLRVVSWNMRASRSATLNEIATELVTMKPDVVALQEVDVGVRRTGYFDQPRTLAAALGFHYVFAASIKYQEGNYGLAVLSRWPLAEVRRHRLDLAEGRERRIILDVTVCVDGRSLRLFDHHADTRPWARDAGLIELSKIVAPELGRGVVVLGDFNESSDGVGIRALTTAGLMDLVEARSGPDLSRIDYVFADMPLAAGATAARIWQTNKSDHNAVVVDLKW